MSDIQRESLIDRLKAEPHLFDPDAAHLLLELAGEKAVSDVSLISHATHNHAATPLSAAENRGEAISIHANYIGLVGPVAALPSVYTDRALDEKRRRSSSYFDFLEIFAAELRELFFASSRKYRLSSLIQLFGIGPKNKVTRSIYALLGLAAPKLVEGLKIEPEVPLYFAGFFANQRRTAVNLRLMLSEFLGYEVTVHQFQKRWLAVDPSEQTRLSSDMRENALLGVTAIAGSSYLDRRSAIRISIGPLRYGEYLSLMPARKKFAELTELARLYCGPSISFEIQLILAKEDIPEARLQSGSPVGRLGWDLWVKQAPALKDSTDAVFDPDKVSETVV
ncbi:type VI secretion system baseplate subunit TssG (plasmid) [Phyllobacterium sp. 628]|uniref:type VI secretion system baseplate subunit TssG n=1 Tax=Phyllobacterium sp. 628 TaxID=2718938 RepID=UPI00166271E9|nr:type VI secretion system baseplate subunit TssG [Phyllobacterium sp. 628]QND55169.1 type VI secretion system baseplate subunit TssG [Phyllobacterium sp. 628]